MRDPYRRGGFTVQPWLNEDLCHSPVKSNTRNKLVMIMIQKCVFFVFRSQKRRLMKWELICSLARWVVIYALFQSIHYAWATNKPFKFSFFETIKILELHTNNLQGVPRSFEQDFSRKNSKSWQCWKKSWKFVYILPKQRRSPFNLTDFFDQKFKILISRIFEIFAKNTLSKTCWVTLYLKMLQMRLFSVRERVWQEASSNHD